MTRGYYDDDCDPSSEEARENREIEDALMYMCVLESKLKEDRGVEAERPIREELERLSSALRMEPVMKNGQFAGVRDHEPGYWTERRDKASQGSDEGKGSTGREPFDLFGF